jgi:hypothetical protein
MRRFLKDDDLLLIKEWDTSLFSLKVIAELVKNGIGID